MHFLPFNPVDKRTAITYIDANGDWHRCSKGAPEQVSPCTNNIEHILLTDAIRTLDVKISKKEKNIVN